jgi:hypothetical protein
VSRVGDAAASLSASIERSLDGIRSLNAVGQHVEEMERALVAAWGESTHPQAQSALSILSEAIVRQNNAVIALDRASELIHEYCVSVLGVEIRRPSDLPELPSVGAAKGKVPQGLTQDTFHQLSRELLDGTEHLNGTVVVQGSRAAGTASPSSDIDFAVLVDQPQFDELVRRRFGTPNPGSAKERKMEHAIRTGKIQAGEAGLGALRRRLQATLGIDVDLSVIRRNGPFDTPPLMGVSRHD